MSSIWNRLKVSFTGKSIAFNKSQSFPVFYRKMSSLAQELVPPTNRGMMELDRSRFSKEFNLCCVFFPDAKSISSFLKNNKEDIMSIPRMRFIEQIEKTTEKNPKGKVIVLTDKLRDVQKAKEVLSEKTLEEIENRNGEILPYKATLDYFFWKADEILASVLPEELLDEIPTSYTMTGHIAHLNLRDQYKPYDKLIGQVILDKTPSLRTVVDKLDTIDTEFRTFKMKVIAGDDDFIVSQKESGCTFTFDFSKVYWNSRLSTEHGRLVDTFKPKTDVVFDVMAGVGPFAIPAGKKQCFVFANDLNPESYKYLKHNIDSNKVGNFVKAVNLDGRQFIKDSPKLIQGFSLKEEEVVIKSHTHSKKIKLENGKSQKVDERIPIPAFISHYVMNLPGSAIEFIDAYRGLFTGAYPNMTPEEVKKLPGYRLPIVNFHHFEKFSADETPEPTEKELHKRVWEKMCKILDYSIDFDTVSFHTVRSVAPNKPMFCVSFKLPEGLVFAK